MEIFRNFIDGGYFVASEMMFFWEITIYYLLNEIVIQHLISFITRSNRVVSST